MEKARILVIRLSSIGDVILSSAALETARASQGVDWVVAEEFVSLLEGHRNVRRVIPFKRSSGTGDWIRLCRTLWAEGYLEVWDLHSSLRSGLARLLFFGWDLIHGRKPGRWRRLPKGRLRLSGYFIFKRFWPVSWRPIPLVVRCARVAEGSGAERPDLSHLVLKAKAGVEHPMRSRKGSYLCAMPGAHWEGKRWSPQRFADALKIAAAREVVVLGGQEDSASRELASELRSRGVSVEDAGVGRWDLPTVGQVLADSCGYLGNDTGLAHLAEAVGVRAAVIHGPTAPDMGFGPWRESSRTISADLWCRPCGKDGRFCFRLGSQRYACLSAIGPNRVAETIRGWTQ